jgi:hypothetical protein
LATVTANTGPGIITPESDTNATLRRKGKSDITTLGLHSAQAAIKDDRPP